jgi:hypothetical protein
MGCRQMVCLACARLGPGSLGLPTARHSGGCHKHHPCRIYHRIYHRVYHRVYHRIRHGHRSAICASGFSRRWKRGCGLFRSR